VAIDLDASLALLPPGAAVKGIFFNDVIRRARIAISEDALAAASGVKARRYVAFFDYPYVDWMRIAVAAAQALSPDATPALGLRELGRHAYDAFLDTQIGRVLLGVFDLDAGAVLRRGPKAYALVLNFGEITAQFVSDKVARYRFRGFPGFLETYQVGVLEGVLVHCKVEGRVLIALEDLANAVIEVSF
jgi:uncharacterized protein (TIGR02265 family)